MKTHFEVLNDIIKDENKKDLHEIAEIVISLVNSVGKKIECLDRVIGALIHNQEILANSVADIMEME